MDDTRREFLIRMARSAAYAAPVVVSLSAPEGLAAQKTASDKGGGGGKTKSTTADFSTNLDATSPTTATAPWAVPPPGSSGPPGGE